MPTTTADFNLEDFDLTATTLSTVTDAYSNVWSLVNPYQTTVSTYGSILQKTPQSSEEYTDDTALRGDAYVVIPQLDVLVTDAFFEAKPIDYEVVKLKWSIGVGLQSTYGATPVPTEVVIRWDTIGEPQTVANGKLVTKVTADNAISEMDHTGVPSGTWIYYSIFVKYSTTAYRHWYEKVASVHVQTPTRYQSSDLLWQRIPRHYRIQDGSDSFNIPPSSELFARGPLYRLLSTFGWDIDRLRTLAHHQMVTRDPMLATTEALDAMATEVGLPMSSVDLGTERLRNFLGDVGYFRQAKGTLDGVRETITAITGCDVAIKSLSSTLLTEFQETFGGTITNTTNDATMPTGDEWVFYSSAASAGITAAASVPYGVTITKSAASNYDWVAAKVKLSNVNQSSWYNMLFDVTDKTSASVLAVGFSPTALSSGSVQVDQSNGTASSLPSNSIEALSVSTDDWYQFPVGLGLSGNGTFTEDDMYLYIFFVLGPSGSVTFNNVKVIPDDRYPYEIDVYSQRINMCRDPQFEYGTSVFWNYTTISGTVNTPSHASGRLNIQASTNASISLFTNTNALLADTTIPVELGIPYYFSITDQYDHIVSVSLKSETYGTLSTATETFSELIYSGNYKRKTWKLLRNYEAPWLPKKINDCYLEIYIEIPAGEVCTVFQPILEPINAGYEYFDGDSINGGWLAGESASSGVADYRWGDAGQHASFSYYTSDYRRTVLATYRLMDTILPVTQTDSPASLVLFDRVYGYEGSGRP